MKRSLFYLFVFANIAFLPLYGSAQEDSVYLEVIPHSHQAKSSGFSLVDQWPMYPNGIEGVNQHIRENLRYPEEAKNQKIEGRVLLSYVVQSDGSIQEIKIIQEAHPLLNKEAIRVIKAMERWKPGIQKGKKIKVAYEQAFNFEL